ncbi:MAG: transposase [Clostridia bacterium]|nr:transposase [Clostridia bacterium]
MARKDNSNSYQFNFFEDHFQHSYPVIQNAVLSSWAGPFGDRLFPLIDESIFDPLYSSHGRTSSPINVLFGACLLQYLLSISEDELFLRIMTDLTFQYALHTTTNEALPFSKTTFRRFKTRLLTHYNSTNNDLFRSCCRDVIKKMKADGEPVPRMLKRINRLTVKDLFPLLFKTE